MKSRTLLLFFGVFTFVMGLLLIFVPNLFLWLLALPFVPSTVLFMRLFGALLILNGFYFIWSRNTVDLNVIKSFYVGSFIVDTTMSVITLLATYQGTVNFMGYVFAGAFFAIGLVYIQAYIPLRRMTKV